MAPDERRPRITRMGISGGLLVLFGLIVVVRYGQVMIPGRETTRATPALAVERGPILDRRGRVLAIQTHLDTVTLWRPEVRDVEQTATILGSILERDPREIADRIATTDGFLILQRTITPSQSTRIAGHIRSGELRGVRLQPDLGRSYPERESAAAIVGYTGVDNVGLSGIEYMFSDYLVPDVLPDGSTPTMGHQVFLTLDLAIQSAADTLGRRLLEEHRADNVMITVAKADTAEILAFSVQPSFDPNNFRNFTAEQRRNRAIAAVYEPGSVFKVFSVAALLDLGVISENDRFDTTGGYVTDRGSFTITDVTNWGVINTQQIIKFSSNAGAAFASERADPGTFYTVLRSFGFGSPTGIELNGEERGLLADPRRWSRRSQQTISIGQEIGVTPVQMIAAATAIANDGVLLRPQIVHRIVTSSGEVLRESKREPVREVISPETARSMLRMMHSSTDFDGTGWRSRVDGVSVAAKTGTAEVYDPAARRYSDTHYIASTLAIIPAERPELIVYVVIDYPKGDSFFGGRIAAPAVRELLEFVVPYWDIPRDGDTITEHPGRVALPQRRNVEDAEQMPDLTGLPLRSVLPLLARNDLEVHIEGSGWVRRQSPSAGTPLAEGAVIRIELE